jgi:hypothetical protein
MNVRTIERMPLAERLAREICRVAILRGHHFGTTQNRHLIIIRRSRIDHVLDEACRAIGSGDDGRMEAVGLELNAIAEE